MTLSIRPCTPDDAVRLSTVASATFLETYAGIVEGDDILHHCQTTHAPASYAALLALATGWMAARLGRPVSRLGGPVLATLAVAATMAALGMIAWLATPVDGRAVAVMGHSWLACPRNVLGLSLPALAAALWALRGLAPTRPRRAGLAAGLFAGALGAGGYALGCREESTVFISLWYSAGIAASGLLGALIAPRVLRW